MGRPRGPAPECQGIIHTVKSGDTLYMLAKHYNVTLDAIINANPHVDCYMLQIGMRLCIPTGMASRESGNQYTPSQITPPFMPAMPALPTIPMPEMPEMPTMPTMPMPMMPSMPTMPSMPVPEMPSMPEMPAAPSTPSAPAETPAEETPACSGSLHTVRTGDTLYMLARQYQITLDALMRANPNLDPYNLRVGMQLCIPAPDSGMNRSLTGSRVYATQRGDTLTRVLDRYEITFAALQSANPTIDFSGNLEGLSLSIPSDDLYRTCPMSGAYIVKSGDSLDSISRKLLVITDSLLMSNPTLTIEDFSVPGTKVCIPN